MRVPPGKGWAGRVAKAVRDSVMAELVKRRPDGITAHDFACLDSLYFAAAGLALGYGFLGVKGWIDEGKAAFYPITETCLKLQASIADTFKRLGLDEIPRAKTLWEQAQEKWAQEAAENAARRAAAPGDGGSHDQQPADTGDASLDPQTS
jgi:hypothetical protein